MILLRNIRIKIHQITFLNGEYIQREAISGKAEGKGTETRAKTNYEENASIVRQQNAVYM